MEFPRNVLKNPRNPGEAMIGAKRKENLGKTKKMQEITRKNNKKKQGTTKNIRDFLKNNSGNVQEQIKEFPKQIMEFPIKFWEIPSIIFLARLAFQ